MEIEKLDKLFQSQYNFTTFSCKIPSINFDDYLTHEILKFRAEKGSEDFLIVYYDDHAVESNTA